MAYKKKEIDLETALQSMDDYEYLLAYTYEGILLGKMEEKKPLLNIEELMEARFFSENKELHIFEYLEEKKAVQMEELMDEGHEKDIMIKTYALSSKFGKNGKIFVKEYLSYDDDGQVYVEQTCLAGMEVE